MGLTYSLKSHRPLGSLKLCCGESPPYLLGEVTKQICIFRQPKGSIWAQCINILSSPMLSRLSIRSILQLDRLSSRSAIEGEQLSNWWGHDQSMTAPKLGKTWVYEIIGIYLVHPLHCCSHGLVVCDISWDHLDRFWEVCSFRAIWSH